MTTFYIHLLSTMVHVIHCMVNSLDEPLHSHGTEGSTPHRGEPTKMRIAHSIAPHRHALLARLVRPAHCNELVVDGPIAYQGHRLKRTCKGSYCNRSQREVRETDSKCTYTQRL